MSDFFFYFSEKSCTLQSVVLGACCGERGIQAKEEGTGKTLFGRVEGSHSAVKGEVLCLRTT